MNIKFPVKVRMSSAALSELHACEFGSYEDHIAEPGTRHSRADIEDSNEDGSRCGEYADGRLHIIELIDRSPYKTIVLLNNQAEVDEFFAQAVSGTFGMYHPGVCQRVFDELSDLVSDDVPQWIRNSPRIGY